jgi:hypothetical protein
VYLEAGCRRIQGEHNAAAVLEGCIFLHEEESVEQILILAGEQYFEWRAW